MALHLSLARTAEPGGRKSAAGAEPADVFSPHPAATVHGLHRTLGNRAMRRLLAREPTSVQRQAEPGGAASGVIQRDEEPPGVAPSLPPFMLPGTGLTLIPGPLRLTDLAGLRIPLPASLRATNALSVGTTPTFVLDVSPHLLVGTILDRVDLSTSTVPGTAPGHEEDESNQARISLLRPIVTLDPTTGRLRGWATLSLPTGYPTTLAAPTEVEVEIESTALGRFTGNLAYGPLHADFTLGFHYDTERLERALSPAFTPAGGFAGFWMRLRAILRETVPGVNLESLSAAAGSLWRALRAGEIDGVQFAARTLELIRSSLPPDISLDAVRTALEQLATEVTHPGFTLRGTLGLGPVPLSGFEVEAPTTVPLARPLLGAPAPFPLSYSAYGVILSPPGSITSVAVPAFGYTRVSYGEVTGTSFTSAFLPTLSPTAISAGEPVVNQFPAYLYAELTHVRRFGEDLDVGVRLTVQVSTPEVFGPREAAPEDPMERFRLLHQQYLEAGERGGPAAVPNIGATVFGHF